MRLAQPIIVNGITYYALTPRLRGSPKEWAAYDERADVLQRLEQTASISCDVPKEVLLELEADDFTKLMNEVADMTLRFAETQKSSSKK